MHVVIQRLRLLSICSVGAILAAACCGCGDSFVSIPLAGGVAHGSPIPGEVSITVTPKWLEQLSGGAPLEGHLHLEVVICNGLQDDIWMLDDPAMPYIDASANDLTVRWSVSERANSVSSPFVARIPGRTLLAAGQTVTKSLRLPNPIIPVNHWREYYSFPPSQSDIDNIPEMLEIPAEVLMGGPLLIKAVLGYGIASDWSAPATPDEDVAVSFLTWQQIKESTVRTLENP